MIGRKLKKKRSLNILSIFEYQQQQRMSDTRKHVSTRCVDSAQGTFCNAEYSIKRPSQGKTCTVGFKRERDYQKFFGILPNIFKKLPI